MQESNTNSEEFANLVRILSEVNQALTFAQKDVSSNADQTSYDDLTIFKIYLVMILTNQPTIKGLWRFLSEQPAIREALDLSEIPDRSTLSRRLRNFPPLGWHAHNRVIKPSNQ